jgi:hypothetical protein
MKLIINIPDELYEKHLKSLTSMEELEDWLQDAIIQKADRMAIAITLQEGIS